MGQSLLIDMNSGWYKHKTEVNDGLKTGNYNQVLGSLDALNALLPKEYRVIIDTDDYNRRIESNLLAMCGFCSTMTPDPKGKDKDTEGPTTFEYSKLKRISLLLSSWDQIAYGKKYDDFWCCQKCNNLNRFSNTRFKQRILRKPFYLQVVPEPPLRKMGIEDRSSYHNKFAKWARLFLSELNAAAQKFRHEYKPKDQEVDIFDDTTGADDELFD